MLLSRRVAKTRNKLIHAQINVLIGLVENSLSICENAAMAFENHIDREEARVLKELTVSSERFVADLKSLL